jgi:hypothetical protein
MNAPENYIASLGPMPDNEVSIRKGKEQCDVVQLFVHNKAELDKYAKEATEALKQEGKLWIAYPKLSSKLKTDITRDKGWEAIDVLGWEGVTIISIDDTWSALQFKYNGSRGHMQNMQEILANRKKPSEHREVVVPEDLQKLLNNDPLAKEAFDNYAYTHRKEYVQWIESAKRAETRQNRLAKAIEMLKEKKKLS